MAQSKKMNEAAFAKIVKELDSIGEVILTRQNEKQSVMDDFDKEIARYKKGQISEATVKSSIKKTNAELLRLDKSIRDAIVKVGKNAIKSKEFAARQKPKVFRANLSGLSMTGGSKKKTTVKKVAAKKPMSKKKVIPSKTVLAKEMVLDKKYAKK